MATEQRRPDPPAPSWRAVRGQLWQVPTLLLGLAAVLALSFTRPYWYDPDARLVQRNLARARELLAAPNAEPLQILPLLEAALPRLERFPQRQAEAHFLLGSAWMRLAERGTEEVKAANLSRARGHLETSRNLGAPVADSLKLGYRLGKIYYLQNEDPRVVLDYLAPAVEPAADDRAEGYGMLTQAHLRLPQPDLRAALQANQQQLAQPRIAGPALADARLLRGELLFALKQPEEARKALSFLGPDTPPAVLTRARLLQATSLQNEGNWAGAARWWEELLANAPEKLQEPGQASYYLGLCYRQLGRAEDAARAWQRALPLGGDEAQAAGLRLAEVRLKAGQAEEAVELFTGALKAVARPADFRNKLTTADEARQLVTQGCQSLQDNGDFARAEQMALLAGRVAEPPAAQLLLGQVLEAKGRKHAEAARRLGPAATPEDQEALQAYRRAAAAFEQAAFAAHPVQPDWLWRAAADYLMGRDYERAALALERYVQLPGAAERLGEAWFRLAEAHQALRNQTLTYFAFQKCLEYAGPFAYLARYYLARADLEAGRYDEAEAALKQNLELMRLTPNREAHERTIYTLADLLLMRKKYADAASRYEEAIRFYPSNPTLLAARWKLNVTYRFLAAVEWEKLRSNALVTPEAQSHAQSQSRLWTEKAAVQLEYIVKELKTRQATRPLLGDEVDQFRQALFALAEYRHELGNYEESRRLYEDLAMRYQHQVEGLIAYRMLWQSYSALGQVEAAQMTLKRAREALDRIEPQAFQGRPADEGYTSWSDWLEAATRLTGSPPPPPRQLNQPADAGRSP